MAALVSRSRTGNPSASVSVVIDELADVRVVDRDARAGDDQQVAFLTQSVARHRANAQTGAFDVDLHRAAAGQADALAEWARDDQSTNLVYGYFHGNDHTRTGGTSAWIGLALAAVVPHVLAAAVVVAFSRTRSRRTRRREPPRGALGFAATSA